jgi:hypothetical protein
MLMENTKPEMQDLPLREGRNTFEYFQQSVKEAEEIPFACTQEEIDSSIEGEHIVNWGDID